MPKRIAKPVIDVVAEHRLGEDCYGVGYYRKACCGFNSLSGVRSIYLLAQSLRSANNRERSVNMQKKIKILDLFSGVGGFSLGAVRAGFDLALAVENNAESQVAHIKNFPQVKHITEDIEKLGSQRLKEAAGVGESDVVGIIGGPPCQGFSLIGQGVRDDPRNRLFYVFFDLIRKIQPAFFIAENVPGIMTEGNTETREKAIQLVEDDYCLLPPLKVVASEFGAPTSRTRFLFIGYKESHFHVITKESFFGDAVGKILVKEALSGLPVRVDCRWQKEEHSWQKVTYPSGGDAQFWKSIRHDIPEGVGDPVAIKRLKENSLVSGCLGTKHTKEVKKRFSRLGPGETDSVSRGMRLDPDGYCPTLRAGTGPDKGSYQAVRPIHMTSNRVITPREAARLQSFPDWFQFSPTKWHSFRQIGNSVCPILAEAVLKTINKKRKI